MKVSKVQKPRKAITLGLGAVYVQGNKTQNEEAYNVLVDPTEQIIRIVGKSRSGVFWGIQSLLSLETNGEVPWVRVEDAPRYYYRGLSVDVARNFLPKDDVMKILDVMAMYKMNKCHLHLTDDEGWRLEIPGLPELTQVRINHSLLYNLKKFRFGYSSSKIFHLLLYFLCCSFL